MNNLLNIKDGQGNWIPIPVITNGIASITQNSDYTLTITLEDGTTYTTTSIRGEKGEKGDKGDQGVQGERGEKGDTGAQGIQGEKGDKGDAFTYADFTPEQLASLKGDKGDKGDAFEYSDFTPQQLASLKGEKGDKGDQGDDYVLTTQDKADIAGLVDVPVDDVQINGTSVVENGVANVPMASSNTLGAIMIGNGLLISGTGRAYLSYAGSATIKAQVAQFNPITPYYQHESTFYGLAKAAGDTTQASSSNTVGVYTDEAKTAIKQMLDVKDDYDSLVVEVSGTDPVITGKPSYRYNCGELYTLSITPPAKGTIDIIFTSGTTPTVLSLPNTVKMPDWWVGVETNTTYEMCITDGVYCGVMSWVT